MRTAISNSVVPAESAIVDVMSQTSNQWNQVRDSVSAVLQRLLVLVEHAPPDLPVTAHWSVADTLAHLATITATDVALVEGTTPDLPLSDVGDLRSSVTVDTIADMNNMILGRFTERRVPVLAARMRADVGRLLKATAEADPQREVAWLGSSRLPLAGLLAHLLNELDIHGWDVARALRVPWRTEPRDAALLLDLFIVGVIRCGYGRLLDHDRLVRPGKVTVTFRSGVSNPVTLALTDGRASVEPLDHLPDVRLSYDPVTFNLMLFGRVGRVRAVLTGKMSVGGRRPWLLPAFMATVRLPS